MKHTLTASLLLLCTHTGAFNNRAVAENSQCRSNPKCNQLELEGECCPTQDGINLYCCDEDVTITFPPTMASQPTSTPVDTSQCSSNPQCAQLNLEGSCCPTKDNVFLYCCEQNAEQTNNSPTVMPIGSTPQPSIAPVVSTPSPIAAEPTAIPTNKPTDEPTKKPTSEPTNIPTISPSRPEPTSELTSSPTLKATLPPTSKPTHSPTEPINQIPTESPVLQQPVQSPEESRLHPVTLDNIPNIIIFDPTMHTSEIQAKCDEIWAKQRNNEMGTERYSLFFQPGIYGSAVQPLQIQIGYYTEVAGLGETPGSVVINGKVEVYNRCFVADEYEDGKFIPAESDSGLCFALNNFWRSLSNLQINVNSNGQTDNCRKTANFWAISQAASMRRVDVRGGDLSLMDYCNTPAFASGGFIADSKAGTIKNGSQQQWISRNLEIEKWSGSVWNQVFTGVVNAPDDSAWPQLGSRFTTIDKTPLSREKPFIYVDNGEYYVRAPASFTETRGISWADGAEETGRSIPLADFFIAKPTDTVETINSALDEGSHLIFAPGVYEIEESIVIERENTVVLGLGIATLTAVGGSIPMKISDKQGIIVAGVTIDAGTVESPILLEVGERDSDTTLEIDPSNPTTLHDVYFRIGGPHIGSTDVALEINSNNVLIDHTWVWRGDHGVEDFDTNDGFEGDNERWITNIGRTGVIVNGDNVIALGLFVEHFQKHNLVWNGEGGQVYLFQNELPYEPPTQEDWIDDNGKLGYAGYKVAETVNTHTLWGGGVYCYNRNNPSVATANGFEVPDKPGVILNRIMTKNLSGPGVIQSVVNGIGAQVDDINDGPSFVLKYTNGAATGIEIAPPPVLSITTETLQLENGDKINSVLIPLAAVSAFAVIVAAIFTRNRRKRRAINKEISNLRGKSLDLSDSGSSASSSEDTFAENDDPSIDGAKSQHEAIEVVYG